MADIKTLAERVDDAARNATEIPQLAEPISLEDAYAIQKQSIGRRVARGERQVGIKMGFTSRAKMVQMGVHDMIWGRLTDAMIVEDGGTTRCVDTCIRASSRKSLSCSRISLSAP
jgi:2-oxo-3-hexenedioate decarboxylase